MAQHLTSRLPLFYRFVNGGPNGQYHALPDCTRALLEAGYDIRAVQELLGQADGGKGEPGMGQRVTPQLRSTNWARTRAFYEDGLGFRVEWEHRFEPGFPVFAQVSRDGLSLFLTEHSGDCQVGGAAYGAHRRR
jgi:hypothetical protein